MIMFSFHFFIHTTYSTKLFEDLGLESQKKNGGKGHKTLRLLVFGALEALVSQRERDFRVLTLKLAYVKPKGGEMGYGLSGCVWASIYEVVLRACDLAWYCWLSSCLLFRPSVYPAG